MTRGVLLAATLLALAAPAAAREPATPPALARALERHAESASRHRPDLAIAWGVMRDRVLFEPLDEATLPRYASALQAQLAACDALPASAGRDTLRARLTRELADAGPQGALRRDPLVWLEVLAGAARAPWADARRRGCAPVARVEKQLARFPDAVRAAALLLRDAPAADPVRLEGGIAQLDSLLRVELPSRTEACKESGRLAGFVVADSLAAASLAEFRRLLTRHER